MEEQNMTIAERARMKMELTVNQPISCAQIIDLKKVKDQVNTLWQENKETYEFLDKVRMYCLLLGKEKKYQDWYRKNKYEVGFKVISVFFEQLKYRLCKFCQNPFDKGRAGKLYCSDQCRIYDFRRKQKEKVKN